MSVLRVRSAAPNVVTLVPMWNRLYAVRCVGGHVVARLLKKPVRAQPIKPTALSLLPGTGR